MACRGIAAYLYNWAPGFRVMAQLLGISLGSVDPGALKQLMQRQESPLALVPGGGRSPGGAGGGQVRDGKTGRGTGGRGEIVVGNLGSSQRSGDFSRFLRAGNEEGPTHPPEQEKHGPVTHRQPHQPEKGSTWPSDIPS